MVVRTEDASSKVVLDHRSEATSATVVPSARGIRPVVVQRMPAFATRRFMKGVWDAIFWAAARREGFWAQSQTMGMRDLFFWRGVLEGG